MASNVRHVVNDQPIGIPKHPNLSHIVDITTKTGTQLHMRIASPIGMLFKVFTPSCKLVSMFT